MKRCGLFGGLAAGLLFAVSPVLAAEPSTPAAEVATQDKADTNSTDGTPTTEKAESASGGFSYRPPMRGAPAARIGGGTRGIGDMQLELVVLAPDHTGLTTREQPTLYWYVSKAVPSRLEVTVINDAAIDPALEEELNAPGRAGIQSIDLAKTGVKLKPGVEYRWFVSAIADPDQRSNDVVASGTIERITPDEALRSEIKGASGRDLARVYAQAGVWYDTIDTLSRMIEKSPGDAALREQRAELLNQVGLKSVAEYTRASGH